MADSPCCSQTFNNVLYELSAIILTSEASVCSKMSFYFLTKVWQLTSQTVTYLSICLIDLALPPKTVMSISTRQRSSRNGVPGDMEGK